MRVSQNGRRGQVIVMVTLALFAMVGAMGLAVDLGWSYFVKKSAQSAADAAALAAVEQAYVQERDEDGNTTYECGIEATCQAVLTCPPTPIAPPADNIQNGCLYAMRNGFRATGRQNVTIEANNNAPPPTAPGVFAYYWATARVSESIPQLFSSLLGNTTSLTSARATAAVVDSIILGSLILLNRENDCVPMDTGGRLTCGVDLLVQANNNQGMDAVRADGGILMASTKYGVDADGRYAGENQGGGMVRSPFTFIRDTGDITLGGSSQWIQSPRNGLSDRAYFQDPMRGKGQPPPPPDSLNLPTIPITNGALIGSSDPDNPRILVPGNYYASDARTGMATGEQLTMSGHLKFTDGGTGFGNYVIFGGLKNQSAGTVVTFDPGRYVLAGVAPTGNTPKPVFDIQNNMTILDGTAATGQNSDAGEIFIFTDINYPGLVVPDTIPPNVRSRLQHGISGFQTGNNADIQVNIHGLNANHPAVPEELKTFAPVVLWQDQQNSVIKYTDKGYIDNSCGNSDPYAGCANTDLVSAASTEMFFKASPSLHMYGTAYQPRGGFTSMIGAGGYDSPLQIIAGSLTVHANSNVRLQETNNPLFVQIVTLVE